MNIGIYLYDQAEVLDFSGPFEVFSTASRISSSKDEFNIFLVGETGEIVTARGGFLVKPNYGFHEHPSIDVLIIAGGIYSEEVLKTQVVDWIGEQSKSVQLIASVCTGVFLLAATKVLTTENVTTHWEDIPDLRESCPDLIVHESERWVDEDFDVTSGGISAGIDMSLHLVSRLYSKELAVNTARQMEFDWTDNE